MTLKSMAATVAALGVILGAAFAVDARYWRVEAGEQAVGVAKASLDASVARLSLSVEELRLKNELASARARVTFLGSKAKPTGDEAEELTFIRSQISLQQKQLLDVQAARQK
jgi:hypothetical protein